ncbi:serine hydrolase [Sphingomonas jaspsi]|uniref:serine hydrolase n=1 Tax=Sphingomonas jaspsi TaxID=392409 RepID=UPI0004B2CF1F|nr:serine hydrolase [Sphingomonas jaspsi]
MTPLLRKLISTALLIAGASSAPAQTSDPLAPLPGGGAPTPSTLRPARPGPAALNARIAEMGRAFDGKAGIAIVSLKDGWEIGYGATALYPQQSCSKLWVAITAMDAVDRGRVSLSDKVTLGRDDLTLFHQPLADKILAGGHTTTLGALLFTAITESDNTANDKLMRSIGGPSAVRTMIAAKGLGSIRFYEGERALQSKIAGLIWSQSYSIGDAFYKARNALPAAVRRAAFDRYVADPYDGAAPQSVARALARLKRGELLSAESTNRLLSIMSQTRTGKLRVRAALPAGWSWSHKTGTGQNFEKRIAGINDIGLLTAPDGTVYAMAIMTVTNRSDGNSQDLMQAVTRELVAYHNARR